MPQPIHRFEATIAGRPVLIEVAEAGAARWRACLVRRPGVPTALMPFYGQTPEAAAAHLRDWLTRVYTHAPSPSH